MHSFELDVHTHTVSSGHYTKDTITDMVKYASLTGLKLLGISEHGPAIPHSCTLSYFRGLSTAPSIRMGVRILYGAEVNILDFSGALDLPESIMKNLDYCMAGMHTPCLGMAMTVAGEKYRIMVFLTKLQYSPVILFYVAAVAIGGKGAVVDFQKDAVVYGSFYKAAIVDRIFRIVRMGDNADIRVFYSTETGSRIFFFGSGGEAGRLIFFFTI